LEVKVVTATRNHAHAMAPHMRKKDAAEVWAAYHHCPKEALVRSLRASTSAWTVLVDGTPVMMFGVGSFNLLDCQGHPWLLATDKIRNLGTRIIRGTRKYLDIMLEMYPELVNYVDARQTSTLRWLRWCGFSIHEAQDFGAEGLPFHKVTLRGRS